MRIRKTSVFQPGGFPIAVSRMSPQPPTDLHSHEFSELVLIVSGSGVHITGGKTYPIKAGDVFVINGCRSHGYRDTHQLALVNILYNPDLLAMPTSRLREVPGYHVLFTLEPAYHQRHGFVNRVHLSLAELTRFTAWVDALEKELKEHAPGFRFMAIAFLMQMVGFLSRACGRSSPPPSAELMRIARAISHLENHYRQPVTLNELAGIAHLSKRGLTRIFQKVMKHSPIDYLIRLRVARAAELLRRVDQKIIEVAYETGFRDSNYFARQFHRVLGISPSHFRKRESPVSG